MPATDTSPAERPWSIERATMNSTAGPGTTRSAIVAAENSRSAWAEGMRRTLPARPHGGNAPARRPCLLYAGGVPAEVCMLVPRRSAPGTAAERRATGRAARGNVRRRDHVELPPTALRQDPVAMIEATDAGRIPELVPVRHGRMAASPFAFYRGGAALMAADLALTPSSRLRVHLCGDCHLANFGLYGTPERNLVFDLNDFDEAAPGPFEWDVKRLAASAVMAARDNGHRPADARAAARAAARGYREAMKTLAEEGPLATWYRHLTADALVTA